MGMTPTSTSTPRLHQCPRAELPARRAPPGANIINEDRALWSFGDTPTRGFHPLKILISALKLKQSLPTSRGDLRVRIIPIVVVALLSACGLLEPSPDITGTWYGETTVEGLRSDNPFEGEIAPRDLRPQTLRRRCFW